MVKPGQVIVRSDSSGQLLRVVDPHAWDIGTSLLEQCFGELRRLVYFLGGPKMRFGASATSHPAGDRSRLESRIGPPPPAVLIRRAPSRPSLSVWGCKTTAVNVGVNTV